ncbi:pyridoxamine 5'-phosphate oxidase family protein [Pedobacter sp. MC2016-24]|uniref:pyridoxamine 5'-phosphate oxidase family protein n=1 Tax=Pedobacter sp. MC2016-24 TaxID=2780090 RepID=UPI00187E1F33|nr:pyridoxamine 5'-phosphate oxidase family protein [Pedobacter sp. MC2016-24]MBE9597814.1 pyridoxamine 5'-phosphate oxidase family protein [Pedobacter sp. MC2016-24]
MDSINKNQSEENKADLSQEEALVKIKELIKQTDTCFFSTKAETGPSNGVRPMSVQEVDDQGNLWMLLANDSHTYKEVSAESKVKLYFQGSKHSDFLYLKANAVIVDDQEKIKALWSPFLKVWFTEGEHDPRIALMKITPEDGYYWDNKHGNVVAGVKMLIGAAIGQTLDDSIEGKIKI